MSVETLRGIVKKKLQDKEGLTKAGKKWVKKTFILTPEDGSKDLFVSTFGKFDNRLIGQTIEVKAEQFNDTSYNSKGDPVAVEEEYGEEEAPPLPDEPEDLPAPKPVAKKRGRPKKETSVKLDAVPRPYANVDVNARVRTTTPTKSTGVDWAKKDRAMAAGGILHDAAALTAALTNSDTTVHDVLNTIKEIAVGLVKVKFAVEEELK